MPRKILLADDSITIQKVVELTFSDGDYEVTAVNNGAKAVQKLAEMRPDIILSDIIMPEKNGYEVCEYVKSHPEYRSIPVVLLTGTFEPFDPDRAEKAGCDAVVTKPFESQSLIHKVEELIAQAQSNASAAPPAPEPAPEPAASPWLDDTPAAAPEPRAPISPFSTATEAVPALSLPFTHDNDIFGAAPSAAGSADMPFETPADLPGGASGGASAGAFMDQTQDAPFGAPPPAEEFSGETRAFPKMSFEEMQAFASGSSAPSAPEPVPTVPPPPPEPSSPWDEPADTAPFDSGAEFGGETRAFTKLDFEEMNRMAPPAPPAAEPEPDSPFGAPPPAEEFSDETRAFPRMSFEELQRMAPAPAPPIETTPEPSPWDEPAEPAAFGGETRAFPKMSFEEMERMASSSAPAWAAEEETPADTPFASTSAREPVLEELPAPGTQSAWAPEPEPESAWTQPEPVPAWSEPEPAPAWPAPEPEPAWTAPEPEPQAVWAAPDDLQPEPQAEPEPAAAAPSALAAPSEPSIPIARELTDEQVDRIARRVVELMSDQVVRNIAWEVIPDLAEMVVKERIRQLEAEA